MQQKQKDIIGVGGGKDDIQSDEDYGVEQKKPPGEGIGGGNGIYADPDLVTTTKKQKKKAKKTTNTTKKTMEEPILGAADDLVAMNVAVS